MTPPQGKEMAAVTVSLDKKSRKLLFLPGLALGMVILVILVRVRQGPVHEVQGEVTRAVRVITVAPTTVVPKAIGYGEVKPTIIWQAIAEVSGKVLEIHSSLEKGATIKKGEALLRIDPRDYELALAKAEAQLEAAQVELKELEIEETNAKASLAIEQRALKLSEQELKRKKELFARNRIARSALDQEERTMLLQRQKVQELKNTLRLIPAKRSVLQARRDLYGTEVAEARRNLERTTIRLPITARISEVNIEVRQYAKAGEVLVVAHGMDRVEINAQIPMIKMRPLVAQIDLPQEPEMFGVPSVFRRLDFGALVRLQTGDLAAEWPARFARVSETIDPRTRTVGAIVEVDQPYAHVIPGQRPPLVNGMYVEVELQGKPWENQFVVPRNALHDGQIYVVNQEQRLEKRPVTLSFVQGNIAVISKGLTAGDKVVVSDLVPAIPGMKLVPTLDTALETQLIDEASEKINNP
jgi:multidrug efflux pump subunit AcrA (membrane-fusion protein)